MSTRAAASPVPSAALTVSKLLNEGTIRIPGGTITQQEILPAGYAEAPSGGNATVLPDGGIHELSDVFTVNPDGSIDPNAPSKVTLQTSSGPVTPTNAQLAGDAFDSKEIGIYFLGTLNANQGMVLAPGSVTNLSGTVLVNPRAVTARGLPLAQGQVVAGGSIIAVAPTSAPALFKSQPLGNGFYNSDDPTGQTDPDQIVAERVRL